MVNGNPSPLRLGGAGTQPSSRPSLGGKGPVFWRAWVVTLVWFIVTIAVLAVPLAMIRPYPAEEGKPARADIRAPLAFSVEDREATLAALDAIPAQLDRIWIRDSEVYARAEQRLNSFLNLLQEENPTTSEQLREFVQKLNDQYGIALDPSTVNQFQENRLLSLRPPLNLEGVRKRLSTVLDNMENHDLVSNMVAFRAHLSQGRLKVVNERGTTVEPAQLGDVLWWPQEVEQSLVAGELPRLFPGSAYADLRQASQELLMKLLGPTLQYDRAGFEERSRREELFLRNNPRMKTFEADELIVKAGEPLTPLQADALRKLNETRRAGLTAKLAGILLITSIFFLAVGIYLVRFRRDLVLDASTVTLHVLPPLMAIAIGQALHALELSEKMVMLWFPAAMVGLLSSLLIAPQVAFALTLVAACLFGVVTGQDLSFLFFTLLGGFAAVFASRRVRARGEVLWVGVQVGLVNILALLILRMLHAEPLGDRLSMLGAFLSGIACAFGTLILLVIFERSFGIVTDLRLLELTGLRNPLLAQFEEKAPGSYQHVLNVTKLAEAAAQAIGANYLLVRAGAYFHDVGKMLKPKYFSENQVTLEDKKAHGRLSPNLSVLIIKNHVKEGIELARDYGLPPKVVDFIPQHHGTGLIRYFYTEALKRYGESGAIDEPREEDFRYPGPKPQSIEAAVVMLADSVEAVASSKFTGGQVSEGELRKLVQTAISDKFDDGQFDECDLTMRHLHLIREAFVKTLMGRFHFRVAYPSMPAKREAPRETRETPIAVAGPVAGPG